MRAKRTESDEKKEGGERERVNEKRGEREREERRGEEME